MRLASGFGAPGEKRMAAYTARGRPHWAPLLDESAQMGIYRGYVYWRGHDAGGKLPPVDVLAGLLADDAARARPERMAWCAEQEEEEVLLVHVPPQWLGDWETGHPLAPGYQYIWRVPRDRLSALDDAPRSTSYRPSELPLAATSARPRMYRRPAARRERQE